MSGEARHRRPVPASPGSRERLIVGIDPGSQRTGFGVVRTDGRTHELCAQGVLSVSPRQALAERLRLLHSGVAELLQRWALDAMAVEDVFHAENTRSALVLGHVRGVVLLAGAQAGLPVLAFAPAAVKQQVTGYGRADKGQVAAMVTRLLRLPGPCVAGDASDALAVALCCAMRADPAETTMRAGSHRT